MMTGKNGNTRTVPEKDNIPKFEAEETKAREKQRGVQLGQGSGGSADRAVTGVTGTATARVHLGREAGWEADPTALTGDPQELGQPT